MVADDLNHLWNGYQMTHDVAYQMTLEVSISILYSYIRTIVEILFVE